jgi:hypothetical protein
MLQVPVKPVPTPHEPLSQVAFVWQTAELVLQVPAVAPVPAPHEPLSQFAFV